MDKKYFGNVRPEKQTRERRERRDMKNNQCNMHTYAKYLRFWIHDKCNSDFIIVRYVFL